jgi:5-(carboxyamino)imidazole ribonucleotide synthase
MKKPFQKTIGIIGGGQLGKMLIESGMPWNVQYNVIDPDTNASCRDYAKHFIHAGLKDGQAIIELSGKSDVITYEIEHVNTEVLLELEKQGKEVIPSPQILKVIQDKGLQKEFYAKNHLPTANYILVQSHEAWLEGINQLKGDKVVVKLCQGGYDGKGVSIVTKQSIKEGNFPFDGACVLEEFVSNCREIAVIVASDGSETFTWPSIEMVFDPKLNLVDYLFSPSNIDKSLETKACELAKKAIIAFNGKGVFAVELFLTPDGDFLINEIAPRPHNSGHHTIEANYTSQYEQLNRILLGLPLGNTELIKPAVMVNLIGPPDVTGDYQITGLEKAFQTPGFYLHLYKKNETRSGRKMGHFTMMADNTHEAITLALEIKNTIKIS